MAAGISHTLESRVLDRLWRRLGSVGGAEVRFHCLWWLAPVGSSLLLGIITAAALRLSVAETLALAVGFLLALATMSLAHELGHALAGARLGLKPEAIEVLWLGTAVVYRRQATSPRDSALSAASGPAVNLALAGFALTLALPIPGIGLATLAFSGLNLGYALLNLVPVYPQDGGKLLRALLWWLTGDELQAQRLTGALGVGLAAVMLSASMVVGAQLLPLSGVLLVGQSVFLGLASAEALYCGAERQRSARRML